MRGWAGVNACKIMCGLETIAVSRCWDWVGGCMESRRVAIGRRCCNSARRSFVAARVDCMCWHIRPGVLQKPYLNFNVDSLPNPSSRRLRPSPESAQLAFAPLKAASPRGQSRLEARGVGLGSSRR